MNGTADTHQQAYPVSAVPTMPTTSIRKAPNRAARSQPNIVAGALPRVAIAVIGPIRTSHSPHGTRVVRTWDRIAFAEAIAAHRLGGSGRGRAAPGFDPQALATWAVARSIKRSMIRCG